MHTHPTLAVVSRLPGILAYNPPHCYVQFRLLAVQLEAVNRWQLTDNQQAWNAGMLPIVLILRCCCRGIVVATYYSSTVPTFVCGSSLLCPRGLKTWTNNIPVRSPHTSHSYCGSLLLLPRTRSYYTKYVNYYDIILHTCCCEGVFVGACWVWSFRSHPLLLFLPCTKLNIPGIIVFRKIPKIASVNHVRTITTTNK